MVGRLELGRRNVTEHHHLARRSSSAFAKYADASRRISFARRSSTFSRSNCLDRARSSVVSPGRRPPSRSPCRTQLRSVSAEHPIFFGDRGDRRPLRRVVLGVLEHHPHRSLPHLRGKPAWSRHDPILSRNGASGKPGAVQMPHPWRGCSGGHRAGDAPISVNDKGGNLPPLRRNIYTVSRGLCLVAPLLAPAHKARSEQPQSEESQRSGFGSDQRTNRVIAAKADDVARRDSRGSVGA